MSTSPAVPPRPFTVSEARRLGSTQAQLRSRDLQRPFHGVRSQNLDLTSVDGRCRAYAARLRPGNLFSHETAAALWGMPFAASFVHDALHVAAPAPRRAPSGAGIVGHQIQSLASEGCERYGLNLVSAATAWAQIAGSIPDEDLIALAEFAITGIPFKGILPCATIEQLVDAHLSHPRSRGFRQRERVIPLIRAGALSRPETLLRLLLCAVGLPEPAINDPLISPTPDLSWILYMVCIQYEGDQHRDRTQFRNDIRRIEQLVDAGWTVIKVSADDLYGRPRETASRIASRLTGKGWRGTIDLRRSTQFAR